jgi:hypothetical protein
MELPKLRTLSQDTDIIGKWKQDIPFIAESRRLISTITFKYSLHVIFDCWFTINFN